jgi:hypothetical protein
MKKVMILSAIFAIAMGLTACGDKDTDITYAPAETINISQKSFSIDNAATQLTASVSTSHEFAAYSNQSWITVSPANSAAHEATLTIDVEENTGNARTGKVIVWSGGSRDSIVISQGAGNLNIESPIPGYSLVWNDEFSGKTVGSDWTYEVKPAGWVNAELQNYVKEDQVAKVSNGTLKINLVNDNGTIKSARLYAHNTSGWTYGYIEARLKLPTGVGTWPAFWMMPVNYTSWPDDGEIDIMEEVGYDPNVVVSTVHCNKYNNSGTAIESARKTVSTAQTDFHTYGLEWTSTYMTFYVDGVKLLTYNNDGTGKNAWPFNAAFYPILNLAWGGSWGGVKGVDPTCLPATMEVDYVRVFQK